MGFFDIFGWNKKKNQPLEEPVKDNKKETVKNTYNDNHFLEGHIKDNKEEIVKNAYKDKAEDIRTKLINEAIIPQIKEVFQKHQALNSAMFMLAQFWSDEAEDAVHYEIIYSELNEPDLSAAEKFEQQDKHDTVNYPTIKNRYGGYESFFDTEGQYYKFWNDNHDPIPAFACYCKEGSHQEMPIFEAYSSYALFKKADNNDISMQIIGEKIRPWLEGVAPESEE